MHQMTDAVDPVQAPAFPRAEYPAAPHEATSSLPLDPNPLSEYARRYGLRPVELRDQTILSRYFATLAEPLSDYTFSQLFSWRNSLRILWREIEGHLCVFANGTGDLTLLLPPIGEGGSDRAVADCFEIMADYNASHGVPERTRIEYASEELLARFDRSKLDVQPMGTDYVYDVNRMIDLAGGDLASKRQAKNRFLRNYVSRVEPYDKARHFDACCALLDSWKRHQDEQHAMEIAASAGAVKRQKESLATRLSLEYAHELGLKGMVVYVQDAPISDDTKPRAEAVGDAPGSWRIRGFTFGETLGRDQSSIVIEKTDLEAKGLAQFIFSEFCRQHWSDRPLVNVGDDWGLESLAWTKMSYRPVKLLQKYTIARSAVATVATPDSRLPTPDARPAPQVRPARKDDLAAALEMEATCFTAYGLSKRQLQYLQSRPGNVFLIAEHEGSVVGEAIGLVRHHRKGGPSGRIYSLAVRPEQRGAGIGRQLMLRLLDELSLRGVHKVYLEVERANEAAVRLYESLGFRTVGTLPAYYGEGRDGLHMLCTIAAPVASERSAVA
jgi:ribosomal protein S18 acetylase RimI-like enzyme